MTDADMMTAFAALGLRFSGVDLLFRRDNGWPGAWRAECVATRNGCGEYRIKVHGETWQKAVVGLLNRVSEIDRNPPRLVPACGSVSKKKPGIYQLECERPAGHVGEHISFRAGVYWTGPVDGKEPTP